MKARFVVPAAGIALALLVVGCGGSDSSPAPAPPPPAPAPGPTGAPVASNSCEPFAVGAVEPIVPVAGNLAGKASSPAGRPLTFSAVSQPQFGTVSMTAAGAYTYTRTDPARGNLDSFTYRVTDSEGLTAEATAQVLYGRLRIMPLGDSITEGTETENGAGGSGPPDALRVGYRKTLYDRLTNEGYAVEFVGSRSHGAATGLPYPRHEGTSGITQSGLRSVLGPRLEANPADVVLLHIGTNDVNGSGSTDAGPTAAASNSILSVVGDFANSADNPPVQVLLSTIIGQKNPNPNTVTFNSNLTALHSSNWAAARPRYSVRLVDMHARINPATDLSDLSVDVFGLHPNAAGYAKMGSAWFDFLVQNEAVAKCP